MRRYTRLSNGFSRKVENHAAAVALNYFAYNFIQIHRTLRTSPAMAAGVTDHLWSVADLVAMWESEERRLERAEVGKSGLNDLDYRPPHIDWIDFLCALPCRA